MKNLASKIWRINNLYTIVDKNQKRITFKMNSAQEHFVKNKALRNIILKSRQLGFTTLQIILMLDDVLFRRNFEALFIAHTEKDAETIFNKKVKYAWNNLKENLKGLYKVDANSAKQLKFDFGGGFISGMSVSNSGRSGTLNKVHISEFAKLCAKFPLKGDEIILGTIPAVPLDGEFDIESTAEGMGGHFYDIFTEAWGREPQNDSEFKAHFYNWRWDKEEIAKVTRVIPFTEMKEGGRFREYSELHKLSLIEITYYYLKWLSLKRDWDMLNQEYPTTPEEAFIATGTVYFDARKIQEYIIKAEKHKDTGDISMVDEYPMFTKSDIGKIKLWERPEEYKSYVIGGDVAEGIEGGDYSILTVIDNESCKTVAKFKDRLPPDEMAIIAYALGMWYNKAYMAIEANKDGLWVNTELLRMQYPNMYFREELDDIMLPVKRKVGFLTGTNRPHILSELKRMLNTETEIWNNVDFLRECNTFFRNKVGRPEALSGKNDDEVMAYAIAFEVRRNAPQAFDRPKPEPKQGSREAIRERLKQLHGNKGSSISQNNYY